MQAYFLEKLEESKHQCRHCHKLFRGPEFVTKHYWTKHLDECEKIRHRIDVHNLLRNESRFRGLVWPKSMLEAATEYFKNSSLTVAGSNFGQKAFIPKKREYKDWDAINAPECSISYD